MCGWLRLDSIQSSTTRPAGDQRPPLREPRAGRAGAVEGLGLFMIRRGIIQPAPARLLFFPSSQLRRQVIA